ncbi:hypothetical protein SSX86_023865 [Deinandra increscens subsp. villosa]|uniref:CBS domain-containing protein n=1 Tax=Deinandra increscens subsp. villosa TaxID=3103831 RepID=A0AAP0GN78_9ASTR
MAVEAATKGFSVQTWPVEDWKEALAGLEGVEKTMEPPVTPEDVVENVEVEMVDPEDIVIRAVAHELDLETTPISALMTRNPVFVISDTLAVEALQKMVQGKFRHLPVVENGGVVAILGIAKCLYDEIARMERAAEKGKAIVTAVEGVEKHWGTSVSRWLTFEFLLFSVA